MIGAGGIGFDVSELITHSGESTSLDREAFWKEWGIDLGLEARGGIEGVQPHLKRQRVKCTCCNGRKPKWGAGLGKTTGWIHRTGLKNKNVEMIASVEYLAVDDAGLHISIDGGEPQVLAVDNVILVLGKRLCANYRLSSKMLV